LAAASTSHPSEWRERERERERGFLKNIFSAENFIFFFQLFFSIPFRFQRPVQKMFIPLKLSERVSGPSETL
jgi:hypothetical protein